MRAVLSLAFLLASTPLGAQGYVGGLALDSATSTPLPCIEVALLDTAGGIVTRQLTSSDGVFQLDAPTRGTYRLRFALWNHEPLIGPAEAIEPTVERARRYALSFRPTKPEWGKRLVRDTVRDAPPLPKRNSRVVPRYPHHLRVNGVEGEVVLDFLVDSTGRIVPPTLTVVRSTHHEFATEIVRFLRAADFEPARLDGRPVCALMRGMPFTFSLQRPSSRPPSEHASPR